MVDKILCRGDEVRQVFGLVSFCPARCQASPNSPRAHMRHGQNAAALNPLRVSAREARLPHVAVGAVTDQSVGCCRPASCLLVNDRKWNQRTVRSRCIRSLRQSPWVDGALGFQPMATRFQWPIEAIVVPASSRSYRDQAPGSVGPSPRRPRCRQRQRDRLGFAPG